MPFCSLINDITVMYIYKIYITYCIYVGPSVIYVLFIFQYKTEKDGKIETRVEKKVVITDEGDDDDLDHDDVSISVSLIFTRIAKGGSRSISRSTLSVCPQHVVY